MTLARRAVRAGELGAVAHQQLEGVHGDMKWKKFLYRELCRREEILICKSPSCAVGSDREACFGPEA